MYIVEKDLPYWWWFTDGVNSRGSTFAFETTQRRNEFDEIKRCSVSCKWLSHIFLSSPYIKCQILAVYTGINACEVSMDYSKSFSVGIRAHKGGERISWWKDRLAICRQICPWGKHGWKNKKEKKRREEPKGKRGVREKVLYRNPFQGQRYTEKQSSIRKVYLYQKAYRASMLKVFYYSKP